MRFMKTILCKQIEKTNTEKKKKNYNESHKMEETNKNIQNCMINGSFIP